MIPEQNRSRRDLIATVTGGALLGALWGAAFPIVATERRPTIAVVGHRNAQVILIDVSSARVLLLSGEPDDEVLEVLPAMMTVFRQRIDVLIATPQVLGQHAMSFRKRWRVRHAIALGHGPRPSAIPTTFVTDALDVSLDDDALMLLRIGHRSRWQTDTVPQSSDLWCATLQTPAGNVTIAPDVTSISAVGPEASTLMIVPDAPAPEILAVSPASALALNYDSDSIRTAPPSAHALLRVYPRDVARIVIGKEGLELPEWTAVHATTDAG